MKIRIQFLYRLNYDEYEQGEESRLGWEGKVLIFIVDYIFLGVVVKYLTVFTVRYLLDRADSGYSLQQSFVELYFLSCQIIGRFEGFGSRERKVLVGVGDAGKYMKVVVFIICFYSVLIFGIFLKWLFWCIVVED